MGIEIISTGKYIPSLCFKNNDFTKIETSDDWIVQRTGIKTRYFEKKITTSQMAALAAKNALDNTSLDPKLIKVVIVATMTPDSFTPCCASKILDDLGIRAMAFDINVACSGFVYALNVCHGLLNEGEYGLVIGADEVSKLLDFTDRRSCILFGDGAGAAIIKKCDSYSKFYAMSKTDTNYILNAGGLSQIKYGNTLHNFKLQMKGQDVFRFALEAFDDCFNNLEKNNISIDDIDLFIPHQANYRIICSVARKHNIDLERFYINLDKYGNTSSASVGIALDEAIRGGVLKKNMKVLLIGFGSGLSWGYSLFKY